MSQRKRENKKIPKNESKLNHQSEQKIYSSNQEESKKNVNLEEVKAPSTKDEKKTEHQKKKISSRKDGNKVEHSKDHLSSKKEEHPKKKILSNKDKKKIEHFKEKSSSKREENKAKSLKEKGSSNKTELSKEKSQSKKEGSKGNHLKEKNLSKKLELQKEHVLSKKEEHPKEKSSSRKEKSSSRKEKLSKENFSSKKEEHPKLSASSKKEEHSKEKSSSRKEEHPKLSASSKKEEHPKEKSSSKKEKLSKENFSSKKEEHLKENSPSKKEKLSKENLSSKKEGHPKEHASSKKGVNKAENPKEHISSKKEEHLKEKSSSKKGGNKAEHPKEKKNPSKKEGNKAENPKEKKAANKAELQHVHNVPQNDELSNLNVFDSLSAETFNSSFLEKLRSGASGPEFSNFSLFKQDDPYRKEANIKLETLEFSSPAEDRAFGIIFGMTIGDAMGGRLEFTHVQYDTITLSDMGNGPGGKFKLQPGQWTDDSSMGFCLTDSLIWNKGWNPHDCMQRFLAWWNFGYNNAFRFDKKRSSKHSVGLGANIKASFESYVQNPVEYTTVGNKNTSGNGSVMRLAAVPVYYHDNIDEGMNVAYHQSKTTHQGDEAAECCRLLTFIAIRCINGEQIKDVINNLGETFKSDLHSIQCLANSECEVDKDEKENEDRNWNWKREDFKYSPTRARSQPGYIGSYAMDATAMSLHCIWTTESAQDAILKVVNLCGDADSVGSVTGQLAGAAYGISTFPKDWIKAVQQWDGGDIALRAHYLFSKSYSK